MTLQWSAMEAEIFILHSFITSFHALCQHRLVSIGIFLKTPVASVTQTDFAATLDSR
jgi:hypothetical protein